MKPLTREAVLAATRPATDVSICGVYFLVKDRRIVYVGQSVNVLGRVGGHAQAGKDFDSFACVPVDRDELSGVEVAYIRHFNPPLNRQASGYSTKRRELPLTDRGVRGLKAGEQPTDYRDSHRHHGSGALLLRVYPSGRKRWFFIYNIPTTEKRARGQKYPRAAIAGSEFPTVGMASARKWAAAFRSDLLRGIDPRSRADERELTARMVEGMPPERRKG